MSARGSLARRELSGELPGELGSCPADGSWELSGRRELGAVRPVRWGVVLPPPQSQSRGLNSLFPGAFRHFLMQQPQVTYALKVVGLSFDDYQVLLEICHEHNWRWSATGSAEERQAARKRPRFGRGFADLLRVANLQGAAWLANGSSPSLGAAVSTPEITALPAGAGSTEPALQPSIGT